MRVSLSHLVLLSAVAAAPVADLGNLVAQAKPDSVGAVVDSLPDSLIAPTKKPKRGGLFGKLKSAAKDKTVQAVAKAAACQVVPGGAVVVAAIDAAKTKDPLAATAGAQQCKGGLVPGIPGLANPLNRAAAPSAAAGAVAEAQDPMAALTKLSGKTGDQASKGTDPPAITSLTSLMSQVMSTAAPGRQPTAASAGNNGTAGNLGNAAEPAVNDLKKQLERGRALLQGFAWEDHGNTPTHESEPVFFNAIAALAKAMGSVKGDFEIVAYVEDMGSAALATSIAYDRATFVFAALGAQGVDLGRLEAKGHPGSDAKPRIEIVRKSR